MLSLRQVIKKINFDLYNIKKPLLLFLDVIAITGIIGGLFLLISFIGYDNTNDLIFRNAQLLYIILNIFIIHFVISFILKRSIFKSYQKYWVEIITTIVIAFQNFDLIFLQKNFLLRIISKLHPINNTHLFIILLCLFSILALRLIFNFNFKIWWFQLNPAALLALSFIFLIFSGTILLKLPQMTVNGGISTLDALFTSTSASCVTGLIVQDTATFFTTKGQIIILLLIQLGGFNMLTIATFIASLYRKRSSLSSTKIVSNLMDTDNTRGLISIVRKVIYYTLIIEIIGAIIIYFTWGNNLFPTVEKRIFFSIFHSLSAFNNAGFSLFSNGLFEEAIRHNYVLQIMICILIILGGIGFLVLQDIFSIKNIRQRIKHQHKGLTVHSKLVLRVTAFLILFGTVYFLIIENNRILYDYSWYGKIITSFFHSVTLRTAGFNTIEISNLSTPVFILSILYMLIGASPGSTGGGIKTSTIAIAYKATIDNLRGKEHVELYKRTIPKKSIDKTYGIIIISLSIFVIFTTALSITESDFSLNSIAFEAMSAIGTVGLSMGITAHLSTAGKILIIILMYIGRLGSLTLGVALSQKVISKNYQYAKTHLLIG